MSKITAAPDVSNVKADELQRFVSIWIKNAHDIINGGLDLGNFRAQTLSVTFTAANTDTTVSHNLGRVPVGYLVTSSNAAIVVYDGSVTNTESALYLRASGTGTVQVVVS